MAQLDPSIILSGRGPDVMGSIAQGNALAQQTLQAQQQNALAAFMRENGRGIMSGDANALAGLAQFDPTMALNIQTQNRNNARADEQMAFERQRMAQQDAIRAEQTQYDRGRDARADIRADQQWQMQVEDYRRGISADQAAAEAQQIEDAVKMGLAVQSPEQWDAMMQQQAPELVGMFDQREVLAQRFMSVAEILKGQGGDQFRPASAEEAGRYGSAAGQIGPDGRFYPINPPSGLAIETGPDGQMRVVQGAGAGSAAGKPFTEGQSKDNVYATRAEGALAALDPVADALTSRGDRAAEYVPMGLARGTQSDTFQLAQQAGDEFLQAILRKDTGAAITGQEQELYGKTYLPQPGDSDAVMQQKKQARRRALEALKSGMSPAQIVAQERALMASGSQQIGEAPQGGTIQPGHVDGGYRFKGGDPADPNAWEQVQ